MNRMKIATIGFVFGAALLVTQTGCIGYVDRPPQAGMYAPPAYVDNGIVLQDDYVYYPGYEVYYSSSRRQYVYLEGRSWVSRPAPPRVSAEVLFASPSVRLDFHDSPARHHTTVVKQYPRNWAPPGEGRGNGGNGEGRGNGGNRGNGDHDNDKQKDNQP